MSADACADLVARGDPDRFRAAMTAPPEKRAGLMALYAFNIEIARAPWAASDPMLARIRLQWWRDALAEIAAGAPPRRHEVVMPLATTIREGVLPIPLVERLVAAREADADGPRFANRDALLAYLDATSGSLMELAARHLGAPASALGPVRRFALGAGIAAFVRALPRFLARGRAPLPPGLSAVTLAREGQAALAEARAERRAVPPVALPALLAGWKADAILARAAAGAVPDGSLEPSEARARATLLWRTVTGRW